MDRKSQILDRQKRVFRIAQDPTRYGLTLKMIAADSGLKPDSVRNYASGLTEMPLSALDALCGVLADDLLSLLLPVGRIIVQVPDELDHDEIEAAARDFLAAKGKAHHPLSENQRDLGPNEHRDLCAKATRLSAVGGRMSL